MGYFKYFYLSDTQIKKLYEHFMNKDNKMINYINFTKAIAGPPNKNRVSLAKDILSDLSSKQAKVLKNKPKLPSKPAPRPFGDEIEAEEEGPVK